MALELTPSQEVQLIQLAKLRGFPTPGDYLNDLLQRTLAEETAAAGRLTPPEAPQSS